MKRFLKLFRRCKHTYEVVGTRQETFNTPAGISIEKRYLLYCVKCHKGIDVDAKTYKGQAGGWE